MNFTNNPGGDDEFPEETANMDFTKEELIDHLIALSFGLIVIKECVSAIAAPKEFTAFDILRKRIVGMLRLKFSQDEINQMLREREKDFRLQDILGNLGLGMAMLRGYTNKLQKEKVAQGITDPAELKEALTEELFREVQSTADLNGFIEVLDEIRQQGKAVSEIFSMADEMAEEDSSSSLIDSLLSTMGIQKENISTKNVPNEIVDIMNKLKSILPPGMEIKPLIVDAGTSKEQIEALLKGKPQSIDDTLDQIFGKPKADSPPIKKNRGITGEVDDFLGS